LFFYRNVSFSTAFLAKAAFGLFTALLETVFLEVLSAGEITRLVPLVPLRAVAFIAIAEAAFLELVAARLKAALAFARRGIAACTCNSRADHETLFAGAAFF